VTARRASWRTVFLAYPCPHCGAQPGEDCVTATGHPYPDVHGARTDHGARCPRCGTVLMEHEEPGTLCTKCQLLRRLEIERVSRHRRKT